MEQNFSLSVLYQHGKIKILENVNRLGLAPSTLLFQELCSVAPTAAWLSWCLSLCMKQHCWDSVASLQCLVLYSY